MPNFIDSFFALPSKTKGLSAGGAGLSSLAFGAGLGAGGFSSLCAFGFAGCTSSPDAFRSWSMGRGAPIPPASNQPFTFPSGCSALPSVPSPAPSLNFQLPSQSCQLSTGFSSPPGLRLDRSSSTHLWPSSSRKAAKSVSFQSPGLGEMRQRSCRFLTPTRLILPLPSSHLPLARATTALSASYCCAGAGGSRAAESFAPSLGGSPGCSPCLGGSSAKSATGTQPGKFLCPLLAG